MKRATVFLITSAAVLLPREFAGRTTMKGIALPARSALALVGLAAALLAPWSASSPAQTISPMDGAPVATSREVQRIAPPLDLYKLTVDWSTLGFSATDLANVGPTTQSLVDPPSSSGNLVVGNNPATCPNAQYSTIQSAVIAASPGAHIVVCSGTYVEQVVIPAGKDNLTLQSKKPLAAVIQAPALMTFPEAIVRVQAQNADIQQFTIQGPGGSGCDSLEYGVRVDGGGSAMIEHNHITHIRDIEAGGQLSGCQNGVGVQVGRNFMTTTGSATIRNNQIRRLPEERRHDRQQRLERRHREQQCPGLRPVDDDRTERDSGIARRDRAREEQHCVRERLHAGLLYLDRHPALHSGLDGRREQSAERRRHGDLRLSERQHVDRQ